MNFILQSSSKCGQGGREIQKSENFADVINGCSPRMIDLLSNNTNTMISTPLSPPFQTRCSMEIFTLYDKSMDDDCSGFSVVLKRLTP